MALKRHFAAGDDDDSEALGSRRRVTLSLGNFMNGLSPHEFALMFEPMFKTVVRDEVERGIQRFCHSSSSSSVNQIESSEECVWQLHFPNKLPSTLFTGSRIQSEESKPVKIVLHDANSKKILKSGPLSSTKIEIVVLDGDFGVDDREDWTEKEFNAKVVREREGKRPLVTGDLVVTLKDGVGQIGDINFTDNSSWIRSRKFRLGARVQRTSAEERIREARTEAFIVKDHRGESYKKHHPPSLDDDIWRLERIAKDGAFHKRLAVNGIFTVKGFLQLYITNPASLRNIFGGGISNKTWETIIEHATACILDDKYYMYRATEGIGLICNSIFKVVGATFDGQNYQSLDQLSGSQKRLVENLKRQAYNNLNDFVLIDEPSSVAPLMLFPSLQADPFIYPSLELQNVNIPVAAEDQMQMQLGSNQMIPSLPYTYAPEDSTQLEISMAQNSHSMQAFSPLLRNSFMMRDFLYSPYNGEYDSTPNGSLGSVVLTGHLAADDNAQMKTSMFQGNGLYLSPSNQAVDILSSDFGIHLSRSRKPKARWCKIRAAMKWWISVRRDAAVKRMAKLLHSF